MMPYEVGKTFIIRVPLLSIETYKELCSEKDNDAFIRKCYANDVLMESIAIASTSLYEALRRYCISGNGKTENLIQSIRKFLNRAATRTTPFGLFAGVEFGNLGDKTDIELNCISQYYKRARVDMEWLSKIVIICENNPTYWNHLRFRFNSDCYEAGNRLLAPGLKLQVQREEFVDCVGEAMSVKNTEAVKFIYNNFGTDYFIMNDLILKFKEEYCDLDSGVLLVFLKNLINMSILVSELQPPQVDTKPLCYVVNIIREYEIDDGLLNKLQRVLGLIEQYNQTEMGKGTDLFLRCCDLMGEIQNLKSGHYLQVDMRTKYVCCELNRSVADSIEHFIEIVRNEAFVCEYPESLRAYSNLFIEKYGYNKEIAVQQLLDPDIGLGAPAGYSNPKTNNPLVASKSYIADRIMKIITEKLAICKNKELSVDLEDLDLKWIFNKKNELTEQDLDSMELAFYIMGESEEDIEKGDFLLVTSPLLGSDSACKAIGRFTDLFEDEKTKLFLENLYNQERALSHDRGTLLIEGHEMPINGRYYNLCQNTYGNKLQLAVSLNLPDEKIKIELNDLFVGISQETNMFYVRSLKNNQHVRILLPNMLVPSLYSNTLRFLYEVTNMNYSNVFAIQSFCMSSQYKIFPRIKYGKIVLSPAKWYISIEDLHLKEKSFKQFKQAFGEYRERYCIPEAVYAGNADNRLYLNCIDDCDLQILYNMLKKTPINLFETFSIDKNCWVRNSEKESFVSEIIFPVFKTAGIKEDFPKERKEVIKLDTKSRYMDNAAAIPLNAEWRNQFPGQNGWWYLKLYYNSVNSDRLLGENIYFLCEELLKRKYIDLFFFIRYADPKPHIRLRIHLCEKNMDGDLISVWMQKMYAELNISSCKIDVYEREIERYGGIELINYAEKFFYSDSLYVMQLLKCQKNDKKNTKIVKAIMGILSLALCTQISVGNLENLLSEMVDKKKYREIYHEQRKEILRIIINTRHNIIEDNLEFIQIYHWRKRMFEQYWREIVKQDDDLKLSNSRRNILFSIIHMFCNRYFGDTEKERMIMAILYHGIHDTNEMEKHNILNGK